MNSNNPLTIEQEFKLAIYRQKISKLDDIKIKKHLLKTLKRMMIKDNIIKFFIKNNMP